MRRAVRVFSLLLLLPACGGKRPLPGAPPGPLGIALELEPREVALGEPARLTLLFRRDPGVEAEPPRPLEILEKTGALKVREARERTIRLSGGGELIEREYTVFPFKVGDLAVPSLEVKGNYRGKELSASTGPSTLRVKSVLQGKGPAVEDPGKPLEIPSPFPWLMPAVLGGGLLLAGLLARFFLRRKRAYATVPPPPVPPHVEALRALARIRKRPRNTAREIEALVVDASAVVRRYIEGRFGLRAPERTTEEFLAEVSSSGLFGLDEKSLLESFLFECDRAKFAGWTPPPDRQSALLEAAVAFVERTAPPAEGKA